MQHLESTTTYQLYTVLLFATLQTTKTCAVQRHLHSVFGLFLKDFFQMMMIL